MKGRYCFFIVLFAAACQSATPIEDLLAGRKVEYQADESQRSAALQYPPDLLAGGDNIEGTVSLSEYAIAGVPGVEETEVAEESEAVNVVYRRDGRLRWIEVGMDANRLWPLVRDFWSENLGLDLEKQNARLGLMETEWLNLRSRVQAPGLRAYVDEFLNVARDSGDRDKFLTRLERNENGGTDVYVTHRHIVARYIKDGGFSGYESVPSDDQLQVEMIRRLMLYLAKSDIESESGEVDAQIAAGETAEQNSDYAFSNTELLIKRPFLDSWRIVQIGLDRGGFTIEDRDYQEGVFYIRHSGGPESDKIFGKVETGFFNKLFSDEKPVLRDIRLILSESGGQTRITAEAAEGDSELTELQTSVVLELLYERLP